MIRSCSYTEDNPGGGTNSNCERTEPVTCISTSIWRRSHYDLRNYSHRMPETVSNKKSKTPSAPHWPSASPSLSAFINHRIKPPVFHPASPAPCPCICKHLQAILLYDHIKAFHERNPIMSNFITPPPQPQDALLSFPAPHVLLVTLNRPQSLNCINAQGNADLHAVWEWMDEEPSLRVGVLTGKGRAFCAGADLKGISHPFFHLIYPI